VLNINFALSCPVESQILTRKSQVNPRRDGAGATFKAITAQARVFHDRDLYPFVYDMNGVVVAHGAKADLVGKNLIDFKDQDGRLPQDHRPSASMCRLNSDYQI
jgi:signal transduction histidine kinase